MRQLCESITESVRDTVIPMVGEPESGEKVGMGADGTPTKRIDAEADEVAFIHLKRHGDIRVISEESGVTVYGDSEKTVVIDPIDGTFNAVRDIPFYSTSIAVSGSRSLDDLEYGGVIN